MKTFGLDGLKEKKRYTSVTWKNDPGIGRGKGKRSDTNGRDGVVVNHGGQRWRWEEGKDVCIAVREEL